MRHYYVSQEFLEKIVTLTKQQSKCVIWLMENSANGKTFGSASNIADELGLSRSVATTMITIMRDAGMLHRPAYGLTWLNPRHVFSGTKDKLHATQALYDKSLERTNHRLMEMQSRAPFSGDDRKTQYTDAEVNAALASGPVGEEKDFDIGDSDF